MQALDLAEKLGGIVRAAAFELRLALLVDGLRVEILDRSGAFTRREQTAAAPLTAATGRQKRHERHDAGAPQPNDACRFRSLHVFHPRSSRASPIPIRVQWPGV
jgi:hypothetical protein